MCATLRKHFASAVDKKCNKSFIALYQCLTISENNPGNAHEAEQTEIEGIFYSIKQFVKMLNPQMSQTSIDFFLQTVGRKLMGIH